jgi:hypothetical protein
MRLATKILVSGEHNKVIDVVVREAIANFGDARQSFVAFVETGWDHAELGEVPRLLDEVGGALRMLEQQLPADYLVAVKRYVDVELITRQRVPNSQQLDTMADALASLEYYLEALRDQRPARDEILEIARHALERLRYWPLPALTEEAGAPLTTAEALQLSPDLADALDFGKIEPFHGLAHSSPIETMATRRQTAWPKRLPMWPPQRSARRHRWLPAPMLSLPAGFERSDDIDDEIREVFLEELQEEIANLGELFKPWRDNPEDAERCVPSVAFPHSQGQRPAGRRQDPGRVQLEDREHAQTACSMARDRQARPSSAWSSTPMRCCRSCTMHCATRVRSRPIWPACRRMPIAWPRARKWRTCLPPRAQRRWWRRSPKRRRSRDHRGRGHPGRERRDDVGRNGRSDRGRSKRLPNRPACRPRSTRCCWRSSASR